MKRIVALLLVLVFFIPVAFAECISLDGMSFAELVALKDRINLAIWQSDEWQEVTVPQGVWKVGVDIPAGHWTIKTDASYASITLCSVLDETGKNADIWNSDFYELESITSPNSWMYDATSDRTEVDYELKSGTYVIIDGGNVIFTPYAGKPSLGFK